MNAIVRTTLLAAALALSSACRGNQTAGAAGEKPSLPKELIEATVTALRLEAKAYREKLAAAESGTGPAENVDTFQARIALCEKEMERFRAMKPDDYPAGEGTALLDEFGPVLPAVKREISVTVRKGYSVGAQLDLDDATRSGPFYRLAGITGGCPCALKPGKRYDLTVYLVYRREYFGFIDDCYVYVADFRER